MSHSNSNLPELGGARSRFGYRKKEVSYLDIRSYRIRAQLNSTPEVILSRNNVQNDNVMQPLVAAVAAVLMANI